MRTPGLARSAAMLAACAFAGCGGSPQQSALPSTGSPPSAATVRRASHGISWMSKGVKQQDLLYVSNGDGVVNVYRYWQHTLVGVLTRFKNPLGECTDATGDVYIVDQGTQKIYEYAHGGSKPIKTLDDSPYNPYGCSVELSNGDLAVANFGKYTDYYGNGNIAVYRRSSRTPILYVVPSFEQFVACAYDRRGDLFAAGYTNGSLYYPAFDYLPRDGTKLLPMTLPGPSRTWSWDNVDSVGWDGKYFVALDSDVLYRYRIDVKASFVSMTQLYGGYGIVNEVKFYRPLMRSRSMQIVGAGENTSEGSILYWNYPAGGNPVAQIKKGLNNPYGTAISLGSQ